MENKEKAIAILQEYLDLLKYAQEEAHDADLAHSWREQFWGAAHLFEAVFGGDVYIHNYKVCIEEEA